MWCGADKHNYMCHICEKGSLDSNFSKSVIDKISFFFTKLPEISHIHKKNRKFCKYDWIFLDELLLPYKFYI